MSPASPLPAPIGDNEEKVEAADPTLTLTQRFAVLDKSLAEKQEVINNSIDTANSVVQKIKKESCNPSSKIFKMKGQSSDEADQGV